MDQEIKKYNRYLLVKKKDLKAYTFISFIYGLSIVLSITYAFYDILIALLFLLIAYSSVLAKDKIENRFKYTEIDEEL
jgi:hypothetical protein